MATKNNLPIWLRANAWRELFSRIFEGLETKVNVSPEWLINPATNRHLKLDLFYPEISVAVRFEGLESKQRRQRPSLEEELQQQVRDNARGDLCQKHGVDLIVVELAAENPKTVFQEIDRMLSRAGQRLHRRTALSQQIKHIRTTAAHLSRRIDHLGHLKLYADLWEDRQYQTTPEPVQTTPPTSPALPFSEGMAVKHTIFGPGVVLAVTSSGDDTLVIVDFVTAGQKTLAASLVMDKLYPD